MGEAVDFVVDKTGMKPWMVITIVAVIFVAILAGIGWCIYRFMKKKKPKGAEDGKDAKDDEQGLVDGEQVEAEEVEPQEQQEEKGRIKYRLEYDFTLQELKVTILECAELQPTDWSTGSTGPFVKLYLLPDKKPKYETKVHRKIVILNSISTSSSRIYLMW